MVPVLSVVLNVLFVMMLFGSGIFVVCTPIPLYILLARGRWVQAWLVAGLAIAATVALQWLLLPQLSTWGTSTFWLRLLPLPSSEWMAVWGLPWTQYWGVGYFTYFLVIGTILGLGVQRHWSTGRLLVAPVIGGCLWLSLVFGAAFYAAPHYLGADLGSFLSERLTILLNQVMALNESAGIPADQLDLLKTHLPQIVQLSLRLTPALVWWLGLLVVTVTVFGGRWFLKRDQWMPYQGAMTRWQAPAFCMWLVILGGAAYFFNVYALHHVLLQTVAMNSVLAMFAVFVLQGLLIVVYYARRQRQAPVRWLMYSVILIFFQTAMMVMAVIGLVDFWADFRKLNRKLAV